MIIRPLRFLGAAVAACMLSLAACSTGGGTSPSPSAGVATTEATPTATASESIVPAPVVDNLDAITVTGEFNQSGTVTIPSPMAIDQTRTKVITEGTGAEVTAKSIVKVAYVGVDGRSMQTFDESYSKGKAAEFSLEQVVPGFQKGLTGQKVGSRVLIAMPGSDGYDGQDQTSIGIYTGDTLVFLVDIVDASLTGPLGTEVPIPANLPQVSGGTGKPTVTIPAGLTPPTETTTQVVIQGAGTKVAAGDYLITHYVGYSWKTGQLIDDHFDSDDIDKVSKTLAGLQKGLVGQAAGSRVMVVIPPADAWPNGATAPPVEAGDTVIYVVDILYATSGQ